MSDDPPPDQPQEQAGAAAALSATGASTDSRSVIDETRSRLDTTTRLDHTDWVALATDTTLPTADLLALALEETRHARATAEAQRPRALVVLHHRADEDTRTAAERLLLATDPCERELAAQLMREFGSTDQVTRAAATPAFVGALRTAVSNEDDTQALTAQLSALAWLDNTAARPILVAFAGHAADAVRDTVACGLAPRTIEHTDDGEVMSALLELARDRSGWIRSGVYWEIAEAPTLYARDRGWHELCRQAAATDIDDKMREFAAKAAEQLTRATQ